MARFSKRFLGTYGRYRVYAVPSRVLRDFDGMNFYAARVLGFRPRPGRNEIFVAASSKDMYRTLRHEVVEARLMRDRRWSYWRAHTRALRKERGLRR